MTIDEIKAEQQKATANINIPKIEKEYQECYGNLGSI